jgi:poly-beta-1,6 N-acetyl-D-glucosamine synthase
MTDFKNCLIGLLEESLSEDHVFSQLGRIFRRMHSSPVFYDPKGKRSTIVSRLLTVIGFTSAVAASLFVISLFIKPLIPRLFATKHTRQHRLLPAVPTVDRAREQFVLEKARKALFKEIASTLHNPSKKTPAPGRPIVAAFYAPWQETGLNSLRAHAHQLTHLMPEWLHVAPDGNSLDLTDWNPEATPHNLDCVQIARDNGLAIVPIINNSHEGQFDGQRLAKLLHSKTKQKHLAQLIRDWLQANHFQGINVDFENLRRGDYRLVPGFLNELRLAFAGTDLLISIDVEAGGDTDMAKVEAPCDYVVVMAYDEHSEDGPPGPISSLPWFTGTLNAATSKIPSSKLVVGIGSYAYDWKANRAPADAITYQEALTSIADNSDAENPEQTVQLDPTSLNMSCSYEDDDGNRHTIWMLDAVSAYNQWSVARRLGVRSAAVWALGSEDPDIWRFIDKGRYSGLPDASILEKIQFPYQVDFEGQGEILQFKSMPKEGLRSIFVDPKTHLITQSIYQSFPSAYLIQRSGFINKHLAITFDDGPDPNYTPRILDVLQSEKVPAAFFVIGQNAEKFPDELRREYALGEEIGSHTFTHPNLGAVSDERVELELNATQRAIQSIIGHSTLLFRPPYNADAEPVSAEEVKPLALAGGLGYITVGEYIDPQDWNLTNRPSDPALAGAQIAKSIIDQVHQGQGNVILLHDGGGNRDATIEALKRFIPLLKKEGYTFTGISKLAGVGRERTMPVLSAKERLLVGFDKVVFALAYTFEAALTLAFLAAIFLGLGRIAFILVLALVQSFKVRNVRFNPQYHPTVTALIAAYNEETVIVRTIQSVLASNYPLSEVIVIDDGSSDQTSKVVREAFKDDPRVRLLTQENGGKASALNNGVSSAKGEILFCIDADTQLSTEAVGLLVRHFADERVGAVAGNVKVGNEVNVITKWQAIEYTTSQNLDRRAYSLLNAITVVPGAIGAWRKTTVQSVGGYSSDTLAEDTDLTWRIRQAGWKLETESGARAYTEAPDNFKTFFKQRFRWAFGTLQCLWKHRKATFHHGWFGWVALPTLWIFQVAVQAIAPLVDLQILYSLGTFLMAWLSRGLHLKDWQPLPSASHSLNQVAFLYGLFFTVELVAALIAYRLDRERPRSIGWLFFQRFLYRQIMYGVVYKAFTKAIHGHRQGWGKLARKANVSIPPP